jgi:hypothetical protein
MRCWSLKLGKIQCYSLIISLDGDSSNGYNSRHWQETSSLIWLGSHNPDVNGDRGVHPNSGVV